MSEAIGNNVVQFPPQQGAAPPMPAMQPNPAFQAWLQQAQQVQAIMAENQRRQAQFQAAVDLIKKDGIHGFKLDIEADSTIAPDEQAEQQSRTQFISAVVPLLEQLVPMSMGNRAFAEFGKELTLFGARGFRVARPLEESLEKLWDTIGGMPPQPPKGAQGSGQNPQVEAAKVQAQTQQNTAKVAADVHDTQLKAQTDQMAIAQKQQEAQMKAVTDAAKIQAENERSQGQLAMQGAELAQRERLEQARAMALQSRAARGLE